MSDIVSFAARKPAGPRLRIGLLRLTDSASVIAAHEFGFFADEGLEVEISVEPSWANIADKLTYGFLDAAVIVPPLARGDNLYAAVQQALPLLATRPGHQQVADALQHAAHARTAVGCGIAGKAGVIVEQLARRQIVVKIGLLGQIADVAVHGHVADRAPENARRAGRGKNQAQQQLQRGGLAAARGPSYQNHPIGFEDGPLKLFESRRFKAEERHIQPEVLLVQ